MVTIPVKVKERLAAGLKRFQPILSKAKDRDIKESDTVTIITDLLADIFGYDKFNEITSEYAIKHTFCDLAIKFDTKPVILIECKAIGFNLKDEHIRQAVDYGSNEGIDWVILTNGVNWKVYKILFTKPIEFELIFEFDILSLSSKRQQDLELLYYLTKEAIGRPTSNHVLDDVRNQKMVVNKYVIGQIIQQEAILDCIRKQLKRISPELKVSNEEIEKMIIDEVLKREVLEGDKAADAKKRVQKAFKQQVAAKTINKKNTAPEVLPEVVEV
jgi:predicted type IV restriction endonuclease